MSESGDYTPADWDGPKNMAEARKDFQAAAGRSYAQAAQQNTQWHELLPPFLTTDSPEPTLFLCDTTGSMADKPSIFFGKAPYLDHEVRTVYYSDRYEMAMLTFGDARSTGEAQEKYPLQAQPFVSGKALRSSLKKFVFEKKGGAQTCETVEHGALYCLHNVRTPQAIRKPLLIIYTDEMPYDHVTREMAAKIHVRLNENLIATDDIFRQLTTRFSVYLILMQYIRINPSDKGAARAEKEALNASIRQCWLNFIDARHTAYLGYDEGDRIFDVSLGIFAAATNKLGYFEKELIQRQSPEQVDQVFRALASIHRFHRPGDPASSSDSETTDSTFHRPINGETADDLI